MPNVQRGRSSRLAGRITRICQLSIAQSTVLCKSWFDKRIGISSEDPRLTIYNLYIYPVVHSILHTCFMNLLSLSNRWKNHLLANDHLSLNHIDWYRTDKFLMAQAVFIPPGAPPPNYVDPPIRAPGSPAAGIILTVAAIATTSLRLYTRFRSSSLGLDDFFATTGTVRFIAHLTINITKKQDWELTIYQRLDTCSRYDYAWRRWLLHGGDTKTYPRYPPAHAREPS